MSPHHEYISDIIDAIEGLLKSDLGTFMSRYYKYLPKYAIIHYHTNVGMVLSYLKEDREVMIIVDGEGNVRGILTPLEILESLRAEGRGVIRTHFGVTFASRSRKVPIKSLVKLDVVSIMDKHPLVLEDNMSLGDAIDRLSKERTSYAIVVTKDGRIRGVISAQSIIKVFVDMCRSIFEIPK